MKKFSKIMLSAGGALLIGTGAAMSYLKAQQPEPQVSDLTLANIEAMAVGDTDIWPANTGPASLVECPSGCTVAIGKYCASEPNAGPCSDIPCVWANGGGDLWEI